MQGSHIRVHSKLSDKYDYRLVVKGNHFWHHLASGALNVRPSQRRFTVFAWSWWRHQMETFSALLAICAGNSPVHGEFPTQRPVTRSFDVFFDLRLNKRLSKQSRGWWFETLSRPLWRHRNALMAQSTENGFPRCTGSNDHVCARGTLVSFSLEITYLCQCTICIEHQPLLITSLNFNANMDK